MSGSRAPRKPRSSRGSGPVRKKIEDMQIGPDLTAAGLVDELGRGGVFGAGRVKKAADILEKMVGSDSTNFLGLAGAMVPAGLRRIIAQMVRDEMIDVVVSTGANITHDIMCSFGVPQWREVSYSSDAHLRAKGVSRIYESFLEEEAFTIFERRITDLFDKFLPQRKDPISPSELLFELGSRIDDDGSLTATAARMKIPVFIPAFPDSILGMQTFFYSQTHPIRLDVLADLGRILEISFAADPSGALLIGGGAPKNFILQSKLVAPKGFRFAVQITTDRPEAGGLSGATLDEAISWGKLEEDCQAVTVYGDATIALPLIVAAVRQRLRNPPSARGGSE